MPSKEYLAKQKRKQRYKCNPTSKSPSQGSELDHPVQIAMEACMDNVAVFKIFIWLFKIS